MSFVLWVVVLCASSPHVGPGSSGYLPTASTQQALEQMHNKQEIGGYSNLFTLTCGVVMHVVSGSRESRNKYQHIAVRSLVVTQKRDGGRDS